MPSGRARAREQTAVTLEGVHEQSRSCRRAREREETAPRRPDLAGGHERENRPLSRSKVSRSCRRARSKVSRSCRRARAFARSHSYSYSACRFFAARSVSNRSSHAEWGRVGGHERENRPLSRSKVSMSSPDLAGTSYFLPVPPHAEWECTRERQDTFDTHPKGFAMPHDFAKHRLPNFFNFDSPRPLPARSMCVDVSGSHASITSVDSEAHKVTICNQHPRRGQSCNTTLET